MKSLAKFLLLADGAKRALLFDREQRLLGEVIEDDGFIVDGMMKSARACPLPGDSMLQAVMPPPSPRYPVSCFELTGA